MEEVYVLHVSGLALLLELLHGLFLVLCRHVDGALLAHKTVSLHSFSPLDRDAVGLIGLLIGGGITTTVVAWSLCSFISTFHFVLPHI